MHLEKELQMAQKSHKLEGLLIDQYGILHVDQDLFNQSDVSFDNYSDLMSEVWYTLPNHFLIQLKGTDRVGYIPKSALKNHLTS